MVMDWRLEDCLHLMTFGQVFERMGREVVIKIKHLHNMFDHR